MMAMMMTADDGNNEDDDDEEENDEIPASSSCTITMSSCDTLAQKQRRVFYRGGRGFVG